MKNRLYKFVFSWNTVFFLSKFNVMGITLGRKSLRNGRLSLYLDYCFNGKRQRQYLGIILDSPTDKHTRATNRAKLQLAQVLRSQKEIEYLKERYPFRTTEMPFTLPQTTGNRIDFFSFAEEYLAQYHQKDIRLVRGVFTQLRKFHTGVLLLNDITPRFCHSFLDYLHRNLNGNSPVNYFKKFKMCLNACVESGLILQNPANGIRLPQYNDVTKEILSEKELTQLTLTPCRNSEVKRAFLFSCMSGLRWCDVKLLCYRNIDFAQKRLTLIQKKVAGHSSHSVLHLNLNASALYLLKVQSGSGEERVFHLPSHSYCLRMLNEWTRKAGIRKHISFHCARHTFITNLMASGANIKTAASLAGHSSTRHTEKYIHIIDTQKQQAVDNLPPLPFD